MISSVTKNILNECRSWILCVSRKVRHLAFRFIWLTVMFIQVTNMCEHVQWQQWHLP